MAPSVPSAFGALSCAGATVEDVVWQVVVWEANASCVTLPRSTLDELPSLVGKTPPNSLPGRAAKP